MIEDDHFSEFMQRIGDRFATEPEFDLHYDDITREYGFVAPWWNDLMTRLRDTRAPFIVGGGWWSHAEPSSVYISSPDTPKQDRLRSAP